MSGSSQLPRFSEPCDVMPWNGTRPRLLPSGSLSSGQKRGHHSSGSAGDVKLPSQARKRRDCGSAGKANRDLQREEDSHTEADTDETALGGGWAADAWEARRSRSPPFPNPHFEQRGLRPPRMFEFDWRPPAEASSWHTGRSGYSSPDSQRYYWAACQAAAGATIPREWHHVPFPLLPPREAIPAMGFYDGFYSRSGYAPRWERSELPPSRYVVPKTVAEVDGDSTPARSLLRQPTCRDADESGCKPAPIKEDGRCGANDADGSVAKQTRPAGAKAKTGRQQDAAPAGEPAARAGGKSTKRSDEQRREKNRIAVRRHRERRQEEALVLSNQMNALRKKISAAQRKCRKLQKVSSKTVVQEREELENLRSMRERVATVMASTGSELRERSSSAAAAACKSARDAPDKLAPAVQAA